MARLSKTTLFKDVPQRSETPMDKTTRAAKEILDHEKEVREGKTDRLRKARLAHEAATPSEPPKKATRKKPAAKADK
ncbi:hypothetical protein ACFO5X_15200 [Seohaeicola nanhaiensis]|uniref:Uncharacterized protein n=1 Tax=Seohaeicola nanhaiensis TaxID=1387282 RepID=A0ABV9KIC7_9RHOB